MNDEIIKKREQKERGIEEENKGGTDERMKD